MKYYIPCLFSLISVFHLGAANFYVSPNGNDSWSGTLPEQNATGTDGPFRTLQRARDASRAVSVKDSETFINLRSGTYYCDPPLELGSQDSGTKEYPVTWQSYEGEQAVLSGGISLSPTWQRYRGHIYQANLANTPVAGEKIWQLIYRGQRQTLARYPNYISPHELTESWLFQRDDVGAVRLVACLALKGDYLEYETNVPVAGNYQVWLHYATENPGMQNNLELTVNGQRIQLGELTRSPSWHRGIWCKAGDIRLPKGHVVIRLANTSSVDRRLHLGNIVLTDHDDVFTSDGPPDQLAEKEHRVEIRAESQVRYHSSVLPYAVIVGLTKRPPLRTVCTYPDRLKPEWSGLKGTRMSLFAQEGWYNEIANVDSIDPETGKIDISGRECQGAVSPGNRFFLENIFSELDAPGEWYFNTETSTLYFWPPDGQAPGKVVIPVYSHAVKISAPTGSVRRPEYINFRRLQFADTTYEPDHREVRVQDEGAFVLENARHCSIAQDTFKNCGAYAIWLKLDSTDNLILDNEISEGGAGGIIMTSAMLGRALKSHQTTDDPASQNVAPIRNVISRNRIHDCGLVYKYMAGIFMDSRPASLAMAPGNIIVSNDIHDLPRCGIFGFVNQGGNVIARNLIHDVMLESDDGGGIHICAETSATAPSVITNNVIYNVVGIKFRGARSYGRDSGIGIYLDDLTSHVLIKDNIVSNTHSGAVFVHGGQDVEVTNNLLEDDHGPVLWLEQIGNLPLNPNITVTHNVIALKDRSSVYWTVSSGYTNSQADYNCYDDPGRIGGIQFGPRSAAPVDLAHWQEQSHDQHSLFADFMTDGSGTLSIASDSLAYRRGFARIPPLMSVK